MLLKYRTKQICIKYIMAQYAYMKIIKHVLTSYCTNITKYFFDLIKI